MISALCAFLDRTLLDIRVTRTTTRTTRYAIAELLTTSAPHSPPRLMLITNTQSPKTLPASLEKASPKLPSEIFIQVDDWTLQVPKEVRTRPSLYHADGRPDHTVFPRYRPAALISCYAGYGKKYAAYDGNPISRTASVHSVSKHKAFSIVSQCEEAAQHGRVTTSVEGCYADLKLTVSLHNDWVYLSIRSNDETVVRFHQNNVGQFDHDMDCVNLAYGYARSLILTYSAVDNPIWQRLDEDSLAKTWLSLLLRARAPHLIHKAARS